MDIYEQLKRDEGLSLKPYKCTAGKTTIGYGRNLDDKGISTREADIMLKNDVAECLGAVLRALPWAKYLDQVRSAVLVNMCFNLGISGLLNFRKMLAACAADDYDVAAKEMLNSKWAKQVGKRAERLAKQMKTGEWV